MFISPFFLWLLCIQIVFIEAQPAAPRGYLLSCGSTNPITIGTLTYAPDHGFISTGNTTIINTNHTLFPLLSNLRYFPDKSARKFCYSFPVTKGAKYLLRATYFYGAFDGGVRPPVFDQIVDGTLWGTVNSTDEYAKGEASYYELVVGAQGKALRFCLARRGGNGDGDPFVSAVELMGLDESLYKSVDFRKFGLSAVARNTFGNKEAVLCFPDDYYHRYWQPFNNSNPSVSCQSNVTSSDFWNIPPAKAFSSAITTSRGKKLQIEWPVGSLSTGNYYIVLYFQDNRTPSPFSWRVFNVSLNGELFYGRVNATTRGVSVYATQWPLSGQTQIDLIPEVGIPVGPIINAGEMFQLIPFGARTHAGDALAMDDFVRSVNNPPADWSGDPCLPQDHSWTGATCTGGKQFVRIATLNLTGKGLTGSLPPSLSNLTALVNLWLGGNKLTGSIPDLSPMKQLETLHLENNQFEGSIPKSLAKLPRIREIYLQNNKFSGQVPDELKSRKDVDIRLSQSQNNHQQGK